jgi:hypothetical protein
MRTLLLALLLLGVGVGEAAACSCARVTRQEVIDRAPLAFRGHVRSVRTTRSGRDEIAFVRVDTIIKGTAPRYLRTVSTMVPAMCGYPLRAGRSYDFAGSLDSRRRLHINMCGMVPLNITR